MWTPTTVDTTTNTLYFGTGSATPLYYPGIRPGANPRTNSLVAVDLGTGRMKWWQQQLAHNEWAYDTAQPSAELVALQRDGTFKLDPYRDPADFRKFLVLNEAQHIVAAHRGEWARLAEVA